MHLTRIDMKRPIILLACLWALTFVYAQTPQLDSLEQVYAVEKADTTRLKLLLEMMDIGYNTDLNLALDYTRRGVTLAKQLDNKQWIAKFYEMLGRTHANMSSLDSATYYFDKAVLQYEAIGNKFGKATTYFKIGWVHKRRGHYDDAMKADLEALRMMEELKDPRGIAGALDRVSEDLYNQRKYAEALEYAKKAIELCKNNNLEGELPYALRAAGDASIGMGDNKAALSYYDEAYQLTEKNEGRDALADISNSRGNAYKRLGEYEKALVDYKLTLELSEKVNYPGGISTATANLGEVNILMGRYGDALPYQLKTIRLQEENKDVSNLIENYMHASTIYKNLGNFESALTYHAKAYDLKDSLVSVEADATMSELRTQYETEKNEATIASQETQLDQQRTMQWLYIGLAVLLGLFAISFYRNAAARKKTNQLLAAKNAENELLLKEIHHRVKNNLEVVSSLLALQSAQIDDPNIKDAMQEGQNRVQSIGIVHQKLYQGTNLAAVEMKDYFVNLSDNILDTFGAEDRVTIQCAMDQLELDIDTAVPLGLIVNEILTNALKYAFPDGRKGHIEITLERADANSLHLRIADDGVGKSGFIKGTGFGGQLISLLTKQLGGTMREDGVGGTTVYLDFAVKSAA